MRGLIWIALEYPQRRIPRNMETIIEGVGVGQNSSVADVFKKYLY